MRALRGWLIALLLIGGVTSGVLWYSFRSKPLDVRVIVIGRGRVEETVTSTKAGAVRSRHAADLSVDVAGTVTAIQAREGTRVRAGDALLSLDHREPEAMHVAAGKELRAAEALLEEAEARKRDAVRERARQEQLRQTESTRQADVDAAETQVAVAAAAVLAAQARVEARQAELGRAKVALEKFDLRAPFDGVVASRLVEVGEWATPGIVAMRLIDLDHLYIRAELDEVDLAELKTGLPVRVTLDPWKGRRMSGRVTRVSPIVSELEEQNRTVEVEAELVSGADGLDLKPGTSADVEVILRSEDNRVRVPAQALMEGNRVLVAGADGRAHQVIVRLGLRNWEWAEVLDGLTEGDRVIVSLDNEKLKDGVEIRVTAEEK